MKYNVGDKVRIKSIDWYNRQKNETEVKWKYYSFSCHMTKYCGQIMTISIVGGYSYSMIEDDGVYSWTDEMIEGLVEEEIIDLTSIVMETVEEKPIQNALTYGYNLPEGYQFVDEGGNIINASKIVLEKKKKDYPKTYEECYKIMGVKLSDCYIQGYKSPLLEDLQELLICRDAYWKLYGEEMGLGKPWKNGRCEVVYGICRDYDDIVKQDDYWGGAHIFEFPIREMRDAFYENFKREIEICKEFL